VRQGDEKLIESYELQVAVSTHSAEHVEYEVVAHLDVDISPVLPYLNATLPRAVYAPQGPALSWRQGESNIGFWPGRIAVDHLHSREEVEETMVRLVKLVNETWARRDEITPDEATRQYLQPLEIYRSLPQTNCKACGEATCFNFALKLVVGQAGLEKCTPLYEPAYKAQRVQLESLFEIKWPANLG
jgi:ArsR family metal-binding transcriptional regulator